MIDRNAITKEMLERAMQCKTAEELIELAKSNDIEIAQEEAEAYLAELTDRELDEKMLASISGGGMSSECYLFGHEGCTWYMPGT